MDEQVKTLDPVLWSGKTYPEHSVHTKARTSPQSCRKLQELSVKKPPLFLSLKTDGLQPDVSPEWVTGGGQFSIAWRVFDAQFWGVPQRRRRIALVADFTGLTAPEILFERYGVQGDLTESGTPREKAAGDTDNGVTTNDSMGRVLAFHLTQNPISGEIAPCLSSGSANGECTCGIVQPVDTICIQGNCIDRADTAGCNGKGWTEGVSYTLNTIDRHAVCVVDNHPQDSRVTIAKNGTVQTLNSQMGTGGGNVPLVISIDRAAYNQGINAAYDIGIDENGIAYTAVAKGPGAVAYAETSNEKTVYWSGADVVDTLTANNAGGNQRMPDKQNFNCVIDVSDETQYTVRRLTPLECERLQGFPDGWTDIVPWTDSKGKVHKDSDSARYKALGNSIAIPPWLYVLKNLTLACGADTTMASLFDGIGGFPLIWEYLNGKGSCVWASEIEEFCIAVTRQHFGDVVYQTTTATHQQEEATDDFKS